MPPKGSTTRHQPPPPSLSPPPPHQDDKHDILTVVDFVDALDALPIELTKGYGDLRELDAVLHSTLVNLTEKLHLLISLVSDPTAQPSARFQLLQEIAEEAARFKLGGDDKIRVAGGACDGIATHQKHISALLRNSSLLIPMHPNAEDMIPFRDTVPQSTTKRAAASRANNSPFPANLPGETPTKKKRAKATALSALATGAGMQDDDDDGMSSKAKKAAKEREREKKKKRTALGRALSPSESIASTHGTPALGSTSRHENARNPRAAAARARYADRALSDEDEDEDDEPPLASTSKNRGSAADNDVRANGNGKVKVTDADLQEAFAGRTARQRAAMAAAAAAASGKRSRLDDDDEDEDGEDEHDEKPTSTARKQEASDLKPRLHDVDDDGDVEMDSGEVDTKAYCHCGGVSYGEMIGCDDDDCELEWYHLACVNLTSTPSGTWYCPTCTIRRQNTKPKGKPARRGRGGGKIGKAGKGRGD